VKVSRSGEDGLGIYVSNVSVRDQHCFALLCGGQGLSGGHASLFLRIVIINSAGTEFDDVISDINDHPFVFVLELGV
jgi:hypothetical protein